MHNLSTYSHRGLTGCGTHENIKDLQIQYETMKQKLEEVAMEV